MQPSLLPSSYGEIQTTGATTVPHGAARALTVRLHGSPVGDCDFPFDPDERADQTPPVWLPHLAPAVVLLAPAPEQFREARSIVTLPQIFLRAAGDGEYRVVGSPQDRTSVVLIGGATAAMPVAAVIPLDQHFPARADAALSLWQALAKRSISAADSLTPSRRRRLMLALRALYGHLAGEAYRTIAQGLFGERRVPSGASWKTHDLRDRTIPLVRTGLNLMRGGYLELLTHHRRRRR
jgi:hypothetical protein